MISDTSIKELVQMKRPVITLAFTVLLLCLISEGSNVIHIVVAIRNIGLHAQTQPIPQSNLFKTGEATGLYRVSWYTVVTSTTATSGAISGQLQYTDDDLGAEVMPFMSNVSASQVGPSSGSALFRAVKGTVAYSVAFDSNVNGTPTYNLHMTVERVAP